MRTIQRYLMAMAGLFATAQTAFAAGAREDSSGVFVWLFLAFCGIIVVAQLLPAFLVMIGVAKGIGSKAADAAKEEATVPEQAGHK